MSNKLDEIFDADEHGSLVCRTCADPVHFSGRSWFGLRADGTINDAAVSMTDYSNVLVCMNCDKSWIISDPDTMQSIHVQMADISIAVQCLDFDEVRDNGFWGDRPQTQMEVN